MDFFFFFFAKRKSSKPQEILLLGEKKMVLLYQEVCKTNSNLMTNSVLAEKEEWVIGKIPIYDDIIGTL